MTPQIRVPETELIEVLDWAEERAAIGITDSEDCTYEQGVHDAIRWMLGEIHTRPDEA